jgi:prepilin-type N-terminal cleavage/methylation domain-containing protein
MKMLRISKAGVGVVKPGFTLVELLVVIAIISVLMSMLLPSLQRSRETAYQLKCQSGARGVNTAVDVYCSDNREYYVAGKVTAKSWAQILIDGGYSQETAYTARGGCPHGPTVYSDYAGNDYYTGWTANSWPTATTTYGFNMYLQSGFYSGFTLYGQQKRTGYRVSKHADKVITAMCNVTGWSTEWNTYVVYASTYTTLGEPAWYPKSAMNPAIVRHRGEGLPVSFADGHGVFLDRQTILTGPVYGKGARTLPNFNLMDYSFCPVDPTEIYGFKP